MAHMARPPRPNQKRYRGRIRSDIRSAVRHLTNLYNWDVKYRAFPIASYPNQLAVLADITQLTTTLAMLQTWMGYKGPIPSR